jgi:TonB-dependent SusC/RagA subfamily outer membrane receptor
VSDINPDEIERIEIVKGPSAAALYGTAAANGVVIIQTKRGRAGSTQWSTYLEGGVLTDRNTYPTAYTLFGKAKATDTVELGFNQCNLQRVGIGTCLVDSVAALNLFDNDSLSPLGTGNRYQVGLQLSGGTDMVRYFLAGEREEEVGVMELPSFERSRLSRENAVMHDYLKRPNELARNSFRANLNSAVNTKLDLSLSSAWTNVDTRYSLESNATAGIGSQAFGGPGCILCSPNRVVQAQSGQPPLNTPLYGYRAWTPGYSWQERASQLVNRFLISGTANWRPQSWWQLRGIVGDDFSDRVDDNLLFNGEGPPITATYRNGFKSNVRTDIRNTTVDLASMMQYNHNANLNFRTTVGVQFTNSEFEQNQANGTELPPGAQTPNGAVTREALQSTTLPADARRVHRGGGGDQRPPVPQRGDPDGPEQCVRHELPARVLPEGERGLGPDRRVVLPQARIPERAQVPRRVRRFRRATGPNDACDSSARRCRASGPRTRGDCRSPR